MACSAVSGRGGKLADVTGSWRALQQSGQANQVVRRGRQGEGQPTRSVPRNLVLACSAIVLTQANASSIRLRGRWLAR
jgi:hypothetical protein